MKLSVLLSNDICLVLPEQVLLDEARAERLETMGYNILRFTNEEVLNDIETVLYKIRFYIYNVL